jgi:hypothetical protein
MQTFKGTNSSTGEMDAQQVTDANAALLESLCQLSDEMAFEPRDETSIAVLKDHIASLRRMLGPCVCRLGMPHGGI